VRPLDRVSDFVASPRTRRLAAYLFVVVLFAAGLYRIEVVRAEDEHRNCLTQQANRDAIVNTVNLLAADVQPPPGATEEQLQRIAVSNAARGEYRKKVAESLPKVACPKRKPLGRT
jgi:hypothetical protein